MSINYEYNKESIKVLEIGLEKAESDYNRAQEQFNGGVITEEQFEHITQAYNSANAQLNAAKTQLKASEANIGKAEAAIGSSESQISVFNTQLRNTKLYAPATGLIAKRWLLQGDIVQPGQAVYTVTNNHKLWVMAYLEETKIAGVHLGQHTKFSLDAFPGETFEGKVIYIGSNTASQFSLIPPNNASGNFTKVTQRIPVKISIEGTESNEPLSKFDILAGMSVVIRILIDK